MYSGGANGISPGSYNPQSQDQTSYVMMPGMEGHIDPTQIASHPGDTVRSFAPSTPNLQTQYPSQQQVNSNIEQLLTQLLGAVGNLSGRLQQVKNDSVAAYTPQPQQQSTESKPPVSVVVPSVEPVEIPIRLKIEIDITPVINSVNYFRQEEA